MATGAFTLKFVRAASVGLLAATVGGLVVNQLLHLCYKDEEEQELDGFPRSRWILSAAIQAFIFPVLVWLSLLVASGSGIMCGRWLTASAAELPNKSLWYVFALFGSQSRDMCPMPAATSFLMKVHHWVVTIACMLALFAPKGFGLFIAGTFVLELGSLFYNLRTLSPGNKFINTLYQTFMPLSNIAALAGGVLLLQMREVPLWMRVLYFTADVGVCIGRQRHALKDAGLLSKKATETPSQSDPKAQDGVAMQSLLGHRQRKPSWRPWVPMLFIPALQRARAPLADGRGHQHHGLLGQPRRGLIIAGGALSSPILLQSR
ncbi:Hypothetical protein (Fragment) [Durusdinium trenchii]|uniref:Derlin n=1 Tax=Durusdinium trenchii TaxID=1381693 RepID=A0ABP0Q5U3_9DINO